MFSKLSVKIFTILFMGLFRIKETDQVFTNGWQEVCQDSSEIEYDTLYREMF